MDIRISFCSQIKNRSWQLKYTLPINLKLLEGTPHILILLDCNSHDNINSIIEPFKYHSNFKYIKTLDKEYHIAKAKNKAMSYGEGDILVSLDCDNYITSYWLEQILQYPENITHNFSGNLEDGSYGRISCPKSLWTGFKEFYLPCGHHDLDFIRRNKDIIKIEFRGNPPIRNSKDDTKKYTNCYNMSYSQICILNEQIYNKHKNK